MGWALTCPSKPWAPGHLRAGGESGSTGGRIANVGVHGAPVTLHLEDLWTRDVTITTGLVDTFSIPVLLRLLGGNQVHTGQFATHHLPIEQIEEAYDLFARADETGASKVVLNRT